MPLFGRSEPLAAATRALDAATAGRGGTFVVAGEAGIGKSALARSLASDAEARGARVGFGRAWEVGGAPAYWPWSQALEELEAVADQLAAAVGLGGRDRKAASNVERARVNVQRRIKDVIRRIGEHDASLGRYLDATVRTGTYCVYQPV